MTSSDWKIPIPEERVVWRGDRTIGLLLLGFTLAVALILASFFIPRSWMDHSEVVLPLTIVPFALTLFIARTEFVITTLRAYSRRRGAKRTLAEVPMNSFSSLTISRKWWHRPLGLADIILRIDDDRLIFPAVENWLDAVDAMRRLQEEANQSLVAVYHSQTVDMFVPAPSVASENDSESEVELAPEIEESERLSPLRYFWPSSVLIITVGSLFALGSFRSQAVEFPLDDAIYPRGKKRSQEEIVRFMEQEVMPFARESLGPVVGGREKVKCETCHGSNAEARQWKMPAVKPLPEPRLLETMNDELRRSDALVQTAVYGYLASSKNQAKMKWMREVVTPGMARTLHRPSYDFTRSYDYNRRRFALGCYHCHQLDRTSTRVAGRARP